MDDESNESRRGEAATSANHALASHAAHTAEAAAASAHIHTEACSYATGAFIARK